MVNDRGEGSIDVIEKIKFFELKVESRKLMCQTGSSPRKVRILSIADSNSDQKKKVVVVIVKYRL